MCVNGGQGGEVEGTWSASIEWLVQTLTPQCPGLGFSMGGTVAIRAADEPTVESIIGLAPWIPSRLPLDAVAGKRLVVLHGLLDRWLPGVPGVSPTVSRRGFDRALAAGAHGTYTLIPGALHGIALRAHWGRPIRLPRARRWAELVAEELLSFGSRRSGSP